VKDKRKKRSTKSTSSWAEYYDSRSVLDEIVDEDVDLSLADDLREAIRSGRRKHKLQSVTLKLDPIQVRAIKKLATMKSMPYQTLIRHWLAEDLKEELHLVTK
jgi:predicted DNA binding CopG/RHH family protein